MNNHLPECYRAAFGHEPSIACICDRLRSAEQQGVKEATDRLWRYLTTKCGPITGKGMTNGPVCVDEVVAITGGEPL